MNKATDTIVLAGGCFWCTEAVFNRVAGVEEVAPGYTGGQIKNPAYREVCSGRTGHAEGVRVRFNPTRVSLEEILELFFTTHDPTTLNRQGNDVGTQYRSAIFYTSDEQRERIQVFMSRLESEEVFDRPVVTEVEPLETFYLAEEDHLEYYERNKLQPYCQFIIAPKIKKLKKYHADKLK